MKSQGGLILISSSKYRTHVGSMGKLAVGPARAGSAHSRAEDSVNDAEAERWRSRAENERERRSLDAHLAATINHSSFYITWYQQLRQKHSIMSRSVTSPVVYPTEAAPADALRGEAVADLAVASKASKAGEMKALRVVEVIADDE
jgi:hypothetical protein